MTTKKELHDRLDWNLTNHPPASDMLKMKMERVRADYRAAGHSAIDHAPKSSELEDALDHLELACMYTIAAMARHQ